jgi:putative transposase
MATTTYKLYYQRHLPHFQPEGATLFITFRLAGQLPLNILNALNEELKRQQIDINKILDPEIRRQVIYNAQKIIFGKWDSALDNLNCGPDWLLTPEIADLVETSIRNKDGKEYILEAYCIMPNHVHLVCTPLEEGGQYVPISRIMRSLKGSTARYANQILHRQGDFWHHESYDHVVRDHKEFERIVNYVMDNPIRARLPATRVYCK